MNIAGLQKMTLLDYPGKVACTVFLQGCNMRCPFCHNGEILDLQGESFMDTAELMSFLEKRRGLLDAVCITGGEPTLQPDLPELLGAIKNLGYLVKLDTNGTRPSVIRQVVDAGLVDYVAMDVKNSPEMYGETTGIKNIRLSDIEESIRILTSSSVDYELRTTVVGELHSERSIQDMGEWIASSAAPNRVKNMFLQVFVDRETVIKRGLDAPSKEEIAAFADILAPFADSVEVRGA